jgi:uncharacterized membrane protein
MEGTELAGPGASPAADDVPRAMNRLISQTLRIGVLLSAVLAVVGLSLLVAGPLSGFTTAAVQGTPFHASAFLSGLVHGQALDVLLLAFIVLIITPLVRVIISVALFAQAHDRPFTLLTLTVLLLLGISILVGSFA